MGPVVRAAVAAAVVVTGARVGVAPAEHCPAVSVADVDASAHAAVTWFERNQHADGTWAYLVDQQGNELGGYNLARHAGVLLSLTQAQTHGVDGASDVVDGGLRWALGHLVETAGGGRALADWGDPPTGATALLTSALLELDDAGHDRVLRDLGRFLVGQVLPSGAVSARYSLQDGGPVPEARDVFFTGETFWALVGLADRFPTDADLAEAAAAVGAHVPVRDQEEDRVPPTSDHWASYAYGDLGDRMTPLQVAHAERLVGLIGIQVRGESTRWAGGLQQTIRGGPAVGSGLGTLGEAGAGLLRALDGDAAAGLPERMRCVAGMLVARQVVSDDPAVAGAWFTDGVTRMDDQQHALSALLLNRSVIAADDTAVGGGEQRHSVLWLALAALAVANPLRPLPRGTGPRWWPVGALAGAGAVVAVALGACLLVAASGPVLDALDVSPASARAAAGAALAVAAVVTVIRPPSAGGALIGATSVLALAVGADDGARAIPFIVVAALATLAVPERWRTNGAARAVAVVALLVAADLLVDGVLGV